MTTRNRYATTRAPFVPPAPSTIDLHTHTTRSDGVLQPAELVRAATRAGVRTLAVTDHDTLAGVRELVREGDIPLGLDLVTGVEINAVARGQGAFLDAELHILGYGMDLADEAFEALLERQRAARRVRFWATVERLRDAGLPIDAQVAQLSLREDAALGRPTVARALVAAGHAVSVEDAFVRLIGYGGPGYVRRTGIGPVEAIEAIRAAGGLPALAHFREAPERLDVVRELRDHGLGGLEVFYRTFDAAAVTAVLAVTDQLALVPTGGSDYHGDSMTYAESHAGLWVPPNVGERLRGALDARMRARSE
jgi:predicted metal-dependent phosphoesterase TrpH